MNLSKAKILSSVVGVIMVVCIIKPIVAVVLLGLVGAILWINGDNYLS